MNLDVVQRVALRTSRRIASAMLESWVCTDVALAWMLGGTLFIFACTVALTNLVRLRAAFKRGIEALKDSNPLAHIAPDVNKFRHSFQITLPRCAVVMPVKGVHNQSYDNWRTQITAMYGGPLEFFFCVESEDDPAYPHIQRLQAESPEFRIRLLVAGQSWHCSQKIHNQLYGFERAMRTCSYVIVIDDDIKLHPGTIRSWVEEMESDPRVLAASGYAFEVVQPGEPMGTAWLWMLWRLCATTGFSSPNDRPANVWGGAMMFRAKELRSNIYGITDAWRDGGYSEDFITLSLARYHNRTLAVPKAAIFPNIISTVPFSKFWNFLCRQVFVLTTTYATGAQRYIAIGAQSVNATMHLLIFVGFVYCVAAAG